MYETRLSDDANKFNTHYSESERYAKVTKCIEKSIKYRETSTCGTIVLGERGTGKTKLSKRYLSNNVVESTRERDGIFGLYVEAPGSGGLNLLYELMLEELHDISPKTGKIADKKQRVISLINKHDIKVVFIDEIQVVLPSSGLLPTSKFVKDLKEMVNKTQCAWVLLGSPEAEAIVSVDNQLASRFPRLTVLESFNCQGVENTEDFMDFLYDLVPNLPRKSPFFKFLEESLIEGGFAYKDEVNYDNLLRLCLATKGCPRYLNFLLLECIEATKSDEKITIKVMSSAFEECFLGRNEDVSFNPFNAPMNRVKDALMKRGLYA